MQSRELAESLRVLGYDAWTLDNLDTFVAYIGNECPVGKVVRDAGLKCEGLTI